MCHVLVHIHGKSGGTCTQAKLLMARLTYYPLQHAILQYPMGKQTTKTKQSRQHIYESFSQARSSCRKISLPTGLLSTSINDVMNSRPRERNVALPIFIPSATWHDHHFVMTTGWLEIPPWLRKTTFIFISLSPGFTEPRVLTCFDPPAVPGCSAFFPSKRGTVWFWPAETCRRGLSRNLTLPIKLQPEATTHHFGEKLGVASQQTPGCMSISQKRNVACIKTASHSMTITSEKQCFVPPCRNLRVYRVWHSITQGLNVTFSIYVPSTSHGTPISV